MSKIRIVSTTFLEKERETWVTVGYGDIVTQGLAKCNISDKFSKEVGQYIAFARALKTLADEMESIWISRAVSYKDWKTKH